MKTFAIFTANTVARLGFLSGLLLLGGQHQARAFSIWTDAATPEFPSFNDSNPTEAGLKFRSSINGFVTGIRFYKGPANSGPHEGHLWAVDGTLIASVSFTAETGSGWQQQALAAPFHINSNTTYIVSYHAPNGEYAADTNFFAGSGVDSPPLRALADGEDGPNGVYAYGASGTFPNQTFFSANYWVDVVVAAESGLPDNLLTDGSGCFFDSDPSTPVQDFRLLFIQDPQHPPCARIPSSNPGQFRYNVLFTGTPGAQVTFNLTIPYPFVTHGANPIQAYD